MMQAFQRFWPVTLLASTSLAKFLNRSGVRTCDLPRKARPRHDSSLLRKILSLYWLLHTIIREISYHRTIRSSDVYRLTRAGNLARIVAVEAGHEIYGISALRLGRSKVVTHKRQTLKFLKSWFFSLTWPHVNNTPKSIRTTSVLTLWHGSTGIKSSDYTHYEHKVANLKPIQKCYYSQHLAVLASFAAPIWPFNGLPV